MNLSNGFWYISLMIIFSSLFIYTLYKKRDSRLIILYLFMAGLTYFIEYIILVLFNSYKYVPNLLKIDYFDNVFGSVASNAFTVPITAVFVAAFQLNLFWSFLIIGGIIGIELLFLELEIYFHHWWSITYTIIGLILAFVIAKRWNRELSKRPLKKSVHFLTLFFSYIPLHATVIFGLAVMHLVFFSLNWFDNPFRSHVAFATLYVYFTSLLFTSFIYFRLSWVWIAIGIIGISLVDLLLLVFDILQLTYYWMLPFFFIMHLLLFLLLLFINHHLSQNQQKK